MEFAVALEFLNESGLRTYGFELGNWFGFCGVPMGTGLSSFHELLDWQPRGVSTRARWRILMHRLDVELSAEVRLRSDGGALETQAVVRARRDSLLGDLAIHAKFATADRPVLLDGLELDRPRKYIHVRGSRANFTVHGQNLDCRSSADGGGLSLAPYACRISATEARFHTRLLARGGPGQRLIVTSRGALSCAEVGPCPAWLDPFLYRVERRTPRWLCNSQFCSAMSLRTGESVRLSQVIERR